MTQPLHHYNPQDIPYDPYIAHDRSFHFLFHYCPKITPNIYPITCILCVRSARYLRQRGFAHIGNKRNILISGFTRESKRDSDYCRLRSTLANLNSFCLASKTGLNFQEVSIILAKDSGPVTRSDRSSLTGNRDYFCEIRHKGLTLIYLNHPQLSLNRIKSRGNLRRVSKWRMVQ